MTGRVYGSWRAVGGSCARSPAARGPPTHLHVLVQGGHGHLGLAHVARDGQRGATARTGAGLLPHDKLKGVHQTLHGSPVVRAVIDVPTVHTVQSSQGGQMWQNVPEAQSTHVSRVARMARVARVARVAWVTRVTRVTRVARTAEGPPGPVRLQCQFCSQSPLACGTPPAEPRSH